MIAHGGSTVACSCGVEGCRELGWPHEWDPIAAGDDCIIPPDSPHVFGTILPGGRILSDPRGHKVAAPFVRIGSGYACEGCVVPDA